MEEYEVYTVNRVVGSVGGSLGLFLGFSFFDCFSGLVNRTKTKSKKRCKCFREDAETAAEQTL
jgi:hypothetical protein